MILNDVLTKQNVLSQVILENDGKELPKELKVKVMRIRMAYTKAKKAFDAEVQEFAQDLMTDEFKELSNKSEKTEEENAKFEEMQNKINSEYQEFLIQKGNEEVSNVDDNFTESEYFDIVDVNSGNNVEINGNKIKATDFLEIFYDIFVNDTNKD